MTLMERALRLWSVRAESPSAINRIEYKYIVAAVLTHYGSVLGSPGGGDGALLSFHDAFVAAAALAVLGVFLSLFVDDKEAARAAQQRVTVAAE